MRRKDFQNLEKPYALSDEPRQFVSAVDADVPSAGKLTDVVLADLDEKAFGLPVFAALPVHERILVSDYLYQCVSNIESNLIEARLHYLEWQDYAEQINRRYADIVSIRNGQIITKMPQSTKATDDLPNAFEKLHICGFFRAIGSTFDCLGATIIAVVGLPWPLRKSDMGAARGALKNLGKLSTTGKKLQGDFAAQLEGELLSTKPENWFEWTMQYRNMFVHRGRRTLIGHFAAKDVLLYDKDGNVLPRTETAGHLSVDPDKSDIEAMVYSRTIIYDEEAGITLKGVFDNTRVAAENLCKLLLEVWERRKADPSLILQPGSQWSSDFKASGFSGFAPETEPLEMDVIIGHPTMMKRFRAASALDTQRSLWAGTPWVKPAT